MMMKYLIPAGLVATVLAGCSGSLPQGRTLTAQIDGGAGRMLYFDKFVNNRPVHADSVKLDADGKGVMKLPAMPLDFYALTLGGDEVMVLLLDSAENIRVSAKADSLQFPTSVEGSVNTKLLHDYFRAAQAYDEASQHLAERMKAASPDTSAMAEYAKLNADFGKQTRAFILDHLRSPAVLAALNRVNPQTDLPLFQQVKDSLLTSIPNSEYFTSFRDQVDRMAQQALAAKQQEEMQAQLDKLIPVGSEAPDFTQNTPEGKPFKLSSLRGKVVLVDFWASWCRPCRMENPNVVKAYKQYRSKGFDVLGVSLDKTKEAWTNAIKQDGLTWHHVSDLAYWNNAVAQQYGVSSIPFSVLVGRDGKVLAKNLRGPALEAKLAEVLK